jgi:hypothetical protein
VASETANPGRAEVYRAAFETLAGQSGFSFESQPSLNLEAVDGTIRAVILIGHVEGLAEMAAQNPAVGFILVDVDGAVEGTNVYHLSAAQVGADQVAFLAGYMAAVTTFDWRVGAVALNDAAGSQDLAAFEAGVRYFCGWCRPVYPPYYEYPQMITASAADGANGAAAASSLVEVGVETVFVSSDLASHEFLAPLAEAGLAIIAPVEPRAGFEDQWMATIQGDFQGVLEAVWAAMVAGEPVLETGSALHISHLNDNLISVGRAVLVQQAADELQSGFITTGMSNVDE